MEAMTHYIDGNWVGSIEAADPIEVENPATEQTVAAVARGGARDIDAAVRSARGALAGWRATSANGRADLLAALAEEIAAQRDVIAAAITAEVGTPIRVAARVQATLPSRVLASTAELLRTYPFETRVANSIVVEEPVGVVAAITPWNYPLHQAVAKVAPALAAGCTVVLKPSEVAPSAVLMLAEACSKVGLPAGVLNVITGYGGEVGEALTSHPEVDMVSFTGSREVGRHVAATAGRNLVPVSLELGGKSASVVLEDADLSTAVKVSVANCFLNAGQTCNAWSRMLVHQRVYDEACEMAAAVAERYVPSDPALESSRLGPLASRTQQDRVIAAIERGRQDGARLISGGSHATVEGLTGHFVEATLFADVDADSALAQEEIFGPVLAITSFSDVDHAVALANNSRYGLGGAVWSEDEEAAMKVARRVTTGQVDVNGAPFNPLAPFGGVRDSGHGRELGMHGLREYLRTKAIQVAEG